LIDIDRYAYASYLRDMHPADKFSLAVITLLLVLLVDSPGISGLVIIVMFLIVIFGAGVKCKHYLQMMMIPMAFLLVGCATIALDISRQQNQYNHAMVLGQIWIGSSYNSLVAALNLLLRSLAATTCLYFLALTTPMVQIIFVLRKMKLPGVVLDLMLLTYSSIFIFWKTAQHIYTAQLSRSGYGNFTGTMRALAGLGSNLIIKCIKNTDQAYQSLLSRGFAGELNVLEDDYTFRKTNFYPIITFECLLLVIYFLGRF
jgi:cobalt/nickel transport system permease protein